MKTRRYQNSVCKGNYLHKFKILKQTTAGLLERCERCGTIKHFHMQIPNHIYMSYHIRSGLQIYEPLFHREYPQALKG